MSKRDKTSKRQNEELRRLKKEYAELESRNHILTSQTETLKKRMK